MLRSFIITLLVAVSLAGSCQKPADRPSREEWFKEMRQYKHDFLEKELELSQSQRDRFFMLYDQMSECTMKMFEEVRAKETALVKKGDAATDSEYLDLAKAMSNVKSKEGAIEMEYFNKFKQILSPRQMVRLKQAEHKFNQNMMRQHARSNRNARPSARRESAK